MKHALMSVDAGETSGLAFMILDSAERHPLVALSVAQMAVEHKPRAPWDQDYVDAAMKLDRLWRQFRRLASSKFQIPPDNHRLAIEDFILRPLKDSSRSTLSPVYLAMAWQGIRRIRKQDATPIIWIPPDAQGLFPQDSLKAAQLWIAGQQHARSAVIQGVVAARKLGYAGILAPREARIDPVRKAI